MAGDGDRERDLHGDAGCILGVGRPHQGDEGSGACGPRDRRLKVHPVTRLGRDLWLEDLVSVVAVE
jgi:hypothetical protein